MILSQVRDFAQRRNWMSDSFRIVLAIHIFSGVVALFVAPGAMLTRKGGLWHRRWGKVYFWAMALVALTAIVLSLLRPGLFLALVAVFSFYLAFTGYRVLYRKNPRQAASLMDWSGTVLMLLGGAGLVGYGVYLLRASGFGTVAIVFGSIGLLLACADVRAFLRPPADKRAWWFTHMNRMMAAYIATVTAFSAVNFFFLPTLVRWLWPTLFGLVGISVWSRHYRKKFAGTNVRSEAIAQ
jgi:uncharacterized membrane protein